MDAAGVAFRLARLQGAAFLARSCRAAPGGIEEDEMTTWVRRNALDEAALDALRIA
jgi:hypothetical protein